MEARRCWRETDGVLFFDCLGLEGGLLFGYSPFSPIEMVILEVIMCFSMFSLKAEVMGAFQKPIAAGCGICVKPTLIVEGGSKITDGLLWLDHKDNVTSLYDEFLSSSPKSWSS